MDIAAMAEAVRAGDRRALARAVTLVESARADHRAEALARSHHRVSVVTLSPDRGGVDRAGGVTVIRLPTDVPWPFGTDYKTVGHRVGIKLKDRYSAIMRERLHSVLSEIRPDVVHTNSLMGFSVSAWDAVPRT